MPALRRTLAALAGLACTPLPACAAPPEAITWMRSAFAADPDRRVVLLVTAEVDGHACKLQLDTGVADAVLLYAAKAAGADTQNVAVRFAGITRHVAVARTARAALGQCAPTDSAGTLGNGFFEGGTLTLDLKAGRVGWIDGAALAKSAAAQPMFYVRWGARGGHTLVELKRAGVLQGYALLDSGSAAWSYGALDETQWKAATGGAALAPGERVRAFDIPSWGQVMHCVTTGAMAPLQAGTWPLKPEVEHCPGLLFHPPMQVAGIVGLRSFEDQVVTIDYVSGRWLVAPAR